VGCGSFRKKCTHKECFREKCSRGMKGEGYWGVFKKTKYQGFRVRAMRMVESCEFRYNWSMDSNTSTSITFVSKYVF
jgi:hypothetical protein